MEIGIYPKDLDKVREGQTVEIALPHSKQAAEGKIIYLSPIIEEETITARAVAELENPKGDWRPGSFVQVSIKSEPVEASVVIAREAVQVIDGESVVFVKTPEGFQKSPVQVGQSDNRNIEIVAGLEPGVDYAATQTFLLKADLGKDSVEHDD